MSKEIIKIFDTTLRDGEQSPGASMNTKEKIEIAKQLQRLGVDIIEAGFAASSDGDFDAVSQIASIVDKSIVCSLARSLENDIKKAGEAVSRAKMSRIHTFIATSPIHMQYKLKMTPEQVIKKAMDSVAYAKTFVDDVEFSCEDAGRSEISFIKEVIDAVTSVGAKTINIPDTVGYRLPMEMAEMVKELSQYAEQRGAIISVHCHNDLGLAVANSLYSVLNGAKQVECTINGLGERAGNASLEEIVMAIKTRKDIFTNFDTNINTKEIYRASRLIATVTGIEPQPNKAIVGRNAFAHESGIHQDGVLKHQETYEIMKAEDIGLERNAIVLGKLSGRSAFSSKAIELGFELNQDELNKAFDRFKKLADKKRDISDEDIRMIITDEATNVKAIYDILNLQIANCKDGVATAAASIKFEEQILTDAAIGDGTIDAIFKVIDRISGYSGILRGYKVDSVTEGRDALAKVTVKVEFEANKIFIGHGLNIDTMLASARAYIGALNSYLSMKR
jgi:2-isopropylmalate synthase